jgi:hemoglobin/transferrin/lactoferrin receptor protein
MFVRFIAFLACFIVLAAKSQFVKDSSLLKEFVFSANKVLEPTEDVPRQIVTINPKQIALLNQPTTAELLQQTGQVFIQKSQLGGGSPILRGMEANRVLIVIDGIRLNNAIFRSGHLQNVIRINQNTLQHAEVLFGAGSLMYGSDAMGGVIHFATASPELNTKKADVFYRFASAAAEQTVNANVWQGYKKWAWFASVQYSNFNDLIQGKNRNNNIGNLGLRPFYQGRRDSIDRIVANNNIHKQVGSAYYQSDAVFKIMFEPKSYIKHTLNIQYSNTGNVPRYDRLSEFKNDTPRFAEWYYGPELRTLVAYHLDFDKPTWAYNQFKISAAYQYINESRNTRNFNNPNIAIRNEYVYITSINGDFFKQVNKHEIRYGLELNYNFVKSTAESRNLNNGAVRPISTRYPDGGSNFFNAGAYVSNAYEFSNSLIFSYGARFNFIYLNSSFINKSFYNFLPDRILQQNTALSGAFGMVYKFKANHRFYINIANAFRAPNVDDVGKIFDSRPGQLLILPNNNLKPEQSITYEVGSNHNFDFIQLNFTCYYTQLVNAMQVVKTNINGTDSLLYDGVLTPVFINNNLQKGFIAGVGSTVKIKLHKNLNANATFNYTYGDILQPIRKPLDHIPPVFGRWSVDYGFNKFTASFYGLYAGAKTLDRYNLQGEDNIQYATPNGLPAWQTLNVLTALKNKKNTLTYQISVENILDVNYRLFASGISAPGRNYIVSVRVSL